MGEMGKVARGELPADAIRPVPSKMSGQMNAPDTISIKPAQTQPIDKPDMLLVTKKEPEKSLVSSYNIYSFYNIDILAKLLSTDRAYRSTTKTVWNRTV